MATSRPPLADQAIPVKLKLAATWTSFMFMYVYVDLLGFFTPGKVEDILDGKVFVFDLSPTFSTTALASMTIPIGMIIGSILLPAAVSRIANLAVATLYIPYSAFNVIGAGDYLVYYGFGLAVEIVLLALILRFAWTWPQTATSASDSGRGTARARQRA